MAKQLGEIMPESMKGFGALQAGIFKESELDEKTIELIILAFGIAHQCEACIDLHTGKLVEAGANENEVATVAAISTLMGGGPGSAFGAKALAAFQAKSK